MRLRGSYGTRTFPPPTHKGRTLAPAPPTFHIHTLSARSATPSATPSFSSSTPPIQLYRCEICNESTYSTPGCPHLSTDTHNQLSLVCFNDIAKLTKPRYPMRESRHYSACTQRYSKEKRNRLSSSDRNTRVSKTTHKLAPALRNYSRGFCERSPLRNNFVPVSYATQLQPCWLYVNKQNTAFSAKPLD